jgi:two-component system LytT family response regulator
MVRALLIDDEQSTINVLQVLLRQYAPEITDIHTAVGSAAGLEKIIQLQPQIVFLDIEMPGMNGFQLLEQLKEQFFEVVFVTAFDHYAIKALRYSALDYLLKPVDITELQNAVYRFMKKVANPAAGSTKPYIENFLYNLKQETDNTFRLAIPSQDGARFYFPKEIIRCEAIGNYTRFYFSNEKPLLSSKTLKDYEDLLKEKKFLRVHRTHLVNQEFIRSISSNHELHLVDGSVVQVSRRKLDFVKKKLNSSS